MLDLCYVARHAARRLRFTGFPYRGFKTTGIARKQQQLVDNNVAADGKTAAKKWTRTRSILLDEGNPIVYPEKYKLHKTRVTKSSNDAETIDSVDKEEWAEWESNPYCECVLYLRSGLAEISSQCACYAPLSANVYSAVVSCRKTS